MVETRWEELLERSVGVLEKSAVEFVENWKESCTKRVGEVSCGEVLDESVVQKCFVVLQGR